MNKINSFLIGSDPEVFLKDKESGEIVSAIPYIPGDKWNPYPIPTLSKGHDIQCDNVMVEYCIPATADSKAFYASIIACIEYTNSVLPSNLGVIIQSSADLDPKYLQDPAAQKFGCEPDFNAWMDGMPNDSPCSGGTLRTCGGHIHIGYNNPTMATSMELIKALDLYLGVPSIIIDPDKRRKSMYGKAGALRFKPYGVEYRSLSNFWVKDQDLVDMVFKGVEAAIAFVNNGEVDLLSDEDQLLIQTCINTGDEALAYKLINKFKLERVLNKSFIYME